MGKGRLVKLTLADASVIVDKALDKARELGLNPICVAVLDEGGYLKALKREDGATILRPQIAIGKAWGSLAMGSSSRELGERLSDRPSFLGALSDISGGKVVPVAGGVRISQAGQILGAVGVSGDTSEQDEACAIAGVVAAGFEAK